MLLCWITRNEREQAIKQLRASLSEAKVQMGDDFGLRCFRSKRVKHAVGQRWFVAALELLILLFPLPEIRFLRRFIKQRKEPRYVLKTLADLFAWPGFGWVRVGTRLNPTYAEEMEAYAIELKQEEVKVERYNAALAALAERKRQLSTSLEWAIYVSVVEQDRRANSCLECGGCGSTINQDWQSVPCPKCGSGPVFTPSYTAEEARVAQTIAEQLREPIMPAMRKVPEPRKSVWVWAKAL
jgi:hypothetical protein